MTAEPSVEGLDVYLGGQMFAEWEPPSSEVLGLAFAIVILILCFGSVLAMGLPVGVALAGIGVGTILGGLISHLVTLPEFASTLGVMIGLGVGIDYALFIVTRFRENLQKGMSIEQATVVAIDTAGRAVAFAGTTVVISLLGMIVMQMSFITGLAIGAATVVAVTMVASLTLLPALLGFAGKRVEVTRWGGLVGAGLIAVGLVGVGSRSPPLAALGFGLGLLVILASIVVRLLRRFAGARADFPLHREVPMRQAAAARPRPSPTAGAGASSTTPGGPSPPARSCWWCWPCRCSACASGSPTRATTPTAPTPRSPTTCWPRASARVQRPDGRGRRCCPTAGARRPRPWRT